MKGLKGKCFTTDDEATDTSNVEDIAICIRWVDEALQA